MQNNSNAQKALILVGVCTYNRPVMLQNCLQSLALQKLPEDVQVVFCVANNNSNKEHAIHEITSKTLDGHNFKYIFVEDRGISFARNAVLDVANDHKADFIAFIDDDEYAAENWIASLYNKIKLSGVDAVQGKVVYNLPENSPEIIKHAWEFTCAEDENLKHVGTNNIIFDKKLIQDWQLRFNEKLALTGGEDLDFFMKSGNLGGRHIFTNQAVVYEIVPEVRSTMKWQLVRKMRDGFAVSYVMYLNKGGLYVFRKYVVKSVRNIITAPLYICAGILLSKEKMKFKGLQKLSHAVGCIAFTCNIKINGYKKVTGN